MHAMTNILTMYDSGRNVKLGREYGPESASGSSYHLGVSVDLSVSLFPVCEIRGLEWKILGRGLRL